MEEEIVEKWTLCNGFRYNQDHSVWMPRKLYFKKTEEGWISIYGNKNYINRDEDVFDTEYDCAIRCIAANDAEFQRFALRMRKAGIVLGKILERNELECPSN